MMKFWIVTAVVAGLSMTLSAQAQAQAHEHGAARLDIAVEAGRINFQLETPLDNLLGFEHAPRTAAERKRASAMAASLNAAAALFKIDPAAQCVLAKVELVSAPLGLGKAETPAPAEGHADLDGSFEFTCKDTAQAAFIDIGLFSTFADMQRIDVQIAAPKGQSKRTLRRPAFRITMAR